MDTLLQEFRLTLRKLRRSPGFSIPVVGILALGIGATTAVFTLINSILLRPLSYSQPNQLVQLWSAVPGYGAAEVWGLSKGQYLHFKQKNQTFETIGLYSLSAAALGAEGAKNPYAEQIQVAAVDSDVPRVLRIRPHLGRLFTWEESVSGAGGAVVLTHKFWTERFGGDPRIVGQQIPLDGRAAEVIGVLPADAKLPEEFEVPHIVKINAWVPVRLDPAEVAAKTGHQMRVIARLRTAATHAGAQADLAGLTAQLTDVLPQTYPAEFMRQTRFTTRVVPLRDSVVGEMRPLLWMLFAAVALVLVIACANVMSLLLARFEARRQEVAIRAALGATRAQMVKHFFTEALVLVLAATSLGLIAAAAAVQLIRAAPLPIPRLGDVRLGWESVWFSLAIAAAIAITAALLPLLQRTHTRVVAEVSRGKSGSRRNRTARGILATAQVAVTFVLIVAGALLYTSFRNMARVEPGFQPRGVLTFRVVLPEARYGSFDAAAVFYREASARLAALPGVVSVGSASSIPLSGYDGCSGVEVEHKVSSPGTPPLCVPVHLATPGYFRALGVPVTGDTPGWTQQGGNGGVLVSRAFASRIWPGENPVGKRVRVAGDYMTVTGAVGDVRARGLGRPATEDVYFPLSEAAALPLGGTPRTMAFVVRSASPRPEDLLPAVQRRMAEIDSHVPVTEVHTMNELVRKSAKWVSFSALLVAGASAVSLALSVVGIYGIISYLVVQRRNEIGVRMALGATNHQVGRSVVAQSLRLACVGSVIGTAAAVLLLQALRSVLVGVSPWDPAILAGVFVLLTAVSGVASFIPARRAMNIAPFEALRPQ